MKETTTMTARTYYRLGTAVALLTALFLAWAIAALGIIGAGGKPDRMYLGVFVTLVVGAAVVRLRPRGMAYTLLATATAQVVVAVVALATGQQDTPGASTMEILGLTAMYAGLFGLSAWLYWRSAELETRPSRA
jgi:hypothetical protein